MEPTQTAAATVGTASAEKEPGNAGNTARHVPRPSPLALLERFALPILLLAIIAFFALNPESSKLFFSPANVSVVLGNQAVITLVAVAVLFPLVAGHFDFSVGGLAVLSSVVTAAAMAQYSLPIPIACLLGVASGAALGTVNGILVARFGMNAFVSTLGMATLLGGLIQWYTGGLAIIGVARSFTAFGSGAWMGLPTVVYMVLVLLVAAWYLLSHTPYGRSLYAIGSNARAAELVGLPKDRYTLLAFSISGTLAGLAGVILAARTGGANADNGTYLLFPALAAVFLGATAIQPGRFNIVGTVIGVLFVAVSVSGLILSGAENWVDQVFNGLALLVAVGLSSYLRDRRSGKRGRSKSKLAT